MRNNLSNTSCIPTNDPNLSGLDYYSDRLKHFEIERELGGIFGTYLFAQLLITFCAAYSVAVSWHRFVILGEPMPWFRFGKTELKYFLYTAFVMLIWYAATFVAQLLPVIGGALAILIVGILTPVFGARVLVVLPAIAVADKRFSYDSIWRLTKGNVWPIAAGLLLMLLVSLPFVFAVMALDLINIYANIKLPLQLFLHLVALGFTTSYLSVCYKFFATQLDENPQSEESKA